MAVKLVKTFLFSLLGGCLFRLLHIPLPWMLGPLTVTALCGTVLKWPVYWPVGLRNTGLIVLGYLMGASFTLATARQIMQQLPSMVFSTVATIVFCLGMAMIICRRTGISLSSSVIGSVPGGLSQMVVLAEEIPDTDVTVVTFMQTFRLLSVVFIVPFLAAHGMSDGSGFAAAGGLAEPTWNSADWRMAGVFVAAAVVSAFAAAWLHFPTPFLLGPVVGVGAGVLAGFSAPAVPATIIMVAQIFVGTYMGYTMNITSLQNWRALLPYSLLGGVGVVLFSLGVGYVLTLLYPLLLLTAFISTAPGGMTEMGMTAVAVRADLSIVTAYQLFRLLFILFVTPPLLKLWLGARTRQHAGPSAGRRV